MAAYREANRARAQEVYKAWAEDNREKLNAASKVWAAEHPDYVRARSARRRAENPDYLAHLDCEPVSPIKVFERDEWVCHICSKPVDRHLPWPDPASRSLDHVVALANGGAHTYDNVKLAHLGCNSRKGAR